jgi:hypothetical protein
MPYAISSILAYAARPKQITTQIIDRITILEPFNRLMTYPFCQIYGRSIVLGVF